MLQTLKITKLFPYIKISKATSLYKYKKAFLIAYVGFVRLALLVRPTSLFGYYGTILCKCVIYNISFVYTVKDLLLLILPLLYPFHLFLAVVNFSFLSSPCTLLDVFQQSMSCFIL